MADLSRRSFFTGLTAIIAAPAIVRVSSIMPVKPYIQTGFIPSGCAIGYSLSTSQHAVFYTRVKAFVEQFKANGMWQELEELYYFAAPTEELARTNWRRVLG